jgi:putative oxidoreductase
MRKFIAAWCQSLLDISVRLDWLAPLVVRLFFGYFWFETGMGKIENIDGAIARFTDWGIPFPAFNATFSAWAECIGGALLMLGLYTRITSVAMIINMVVAIALVVIKNVHGFDDFVELDEFTYILVFFWLLMAGPGVVSLDTLINRWLGIKPPRRKI